MREFSPERLVELRNLRGWSQAKLAREAGVGQSTINRLEAGETRNPRHVFDVAEALGTTADYLFGLTDDSGKVEFKGSTDDFRELLELNSSVPNSMIPIPMLDLGYGMGGSFVDGPVEETIEYFPRTLIKTYTRAPAEKLCWAQGIGDSMEPTIHDSDMLLIDLSQDALRLNDKVWALAEGDIGMIKRLRVRAGQLEIMSDNADVPNYTVDPDDVRIIGQVVAKIGRL